MLFLSYKKRIKRYEDVCLQMEDGWSPEQDWSIEEWSCQWECNQVFWGLQVNWSGESSLQWKVQMYSCVAD